MPLCSQTARARPFMLLCAPRFSPAFVGLKGPAAFREPHPHGTGFGSIAIRTAPEARRPQSHCTLQPVFLARQLGSMAQVAEPEQPSASRFRRLSPPPLPFQPKRKNACRPFTSTWKQLDWV